MYELSYKKPRDEQRIITNFAGTEEELTAKMLELTEQGMREVTAKKV